MPEALKRRGSQLEELVVVGSECLTRLGPGQLPGVEEACRQVLRHAGGGRRLSSVVVTWAVGSGNTRWPSSLGAGGEQLVSCSGAKPASAGVSTTRMRWMSEGRRRPAASG